MNADIDAWITLDHVTKVYRTLRGRPKTQAVSDVSLQIRRGEILSLLGPNGAGKTTIVRMLAGLLAPTSGHLRIAGHDPVAYRRRYSPGIGILLEGTRGMYWKLTPLENLAYFAQMWGETDRKRLHDRSEAMLAFLGLIEVRHRPVADFSRGMKQKVALALALITDPPLLLLDEPTLGLDVETAHEIKTLIHALARDEGKTILLTTHEMPLAETLSDRVAILRSGRLLTVGGVSELTKFWSLPLYRFDVAGVLDTPALGELRQVPTLLQDVYDEKADVTTLSFELAHPDLFYCVVSKLQQLGAVTVSAGKITQSLEDVFLRLTTEQGSDLSDVGVCA